MLKCLIALTTLLPTALLAATVWTWVDEQGRRHYSDTEVPGATTIELQGAQTFSAPPAVSSPTAPVSTETTAVPYATLEILSPVADETIRNIEGNLPVQIGTYPQLAAGHFVDVILDGARQELNLRSLDITVPEVWRGTHTLQAVIVDGRDRVLIESAPVTFFVHQASSLN